ncbi:speckle-type POZ protein-like [Tigriopus californicus]|uniref:speckle-type POZ protein-like n=1 Tax=Tigriopus californicus TaxID=6832 RepID=UPI0027DA7F1E|nr:speckle-type POZ protein-like [Tigriopus californicus]
MDEKIQSLDWKVDSISSLPHIVRSPVYSLQITYVHRVHCRLILDYHSPAWFLHLEILGKFSGQITLCASLQCNDFRQTRTRKTFKFGPENRQCTLMQVQLKQFIDQVIHNPAIFIKLNVFGEPSCSPTFPSAVDRILSPSLAHDMWQAFENGTGANLTLVCLNEEEELEHIDVQRGILEAASPVFQAMFKHEGFLEKQSGSVKIREIHPEVLKSVLRYLYTGILSNDTNVPIQEVLIAADRFQVEHLKILCEEKLCRNLDHEKVLDLAFLAQDYHAKYALDYAIQGIIHNFPHVIQEAKWKVLTKKYPELLWHIHQGLAAKLLDIEKNEQFTY